MKKRASGLIILIAGLCFTARAASSLWNVDADSQWTNTLSWTAGVPGIANGTASADVATFSTALTADRTVTVDANRNIGGITFGNTGTNGYTLATGMIKLSDGGVIQSLSGMGGTNKITSDVSLMGDGTFSANATAVRGILGLGSVSGVSGKTLTLDGTSISGNNVGSIFGGLAVVKNGNGVWNFRNSTFTGGFTLNSGTVSFWYGNVTGLGTGLVTINGGTLGAGGSDRNLTNSVLVNGNFGLGNSGAKLTFSGGMDLNGATRTITNNANRISIISGAVSNGGLNLAGTGTLFLSGANTYSGGTVISTGTLSGAADAAFGSGDVTVAGGAKLTLTNSVSSDFINDKAKLILGTNSTLNLIFTGADIVGGLSLDGGSTWLEGGTYNAAALSGRGTGTYTGSGSLTVAEVRTLGLYIIQ
ncbi:MAG: autotransporter-associated beta strand repeat-containing protein [Kiritimatiellales bacterium]